MGRPHERATRTLASRIVASAISRFGKPSTSGRCEFGRLRLLPGFCPGHFEDGGCVSDPDSDIDLALVADEFTGVGFFDVSSPLKLV